MTLIRELRTSLPQSCLSAPIWTEQLACSFPSETTPAILKRCNGRESTTVV